MGLVCWNTIKTQCFHIILIYNNKSNDSVCLFQCFRSRLGLDKDQGMIHLEITVAVGRESETAEISPEVISGAKPKQQFTGLIKEERG